MNKIELVICVRNTSRLIEPIATPPTNPHHHSFQAHSFQAHSFQAHSFQATFIKTTTKTTKMATADDVKACMICMEDKFNKTTKTKTSCLFCHEVICRECLKASLLNDTAVDVCCPGCRAAWSQDFMIANLPATFRTSSLKKHREKVLYDREKVQLPMHMDDARRYKLAKDALTPIREQTKTLKTEYMAIPAVADYKAKKEADKKAYTDYVMHRIITQAEYLRISAEYSAARSVVSSNNAAVRLKIQLAVQKRRMREFTRPVNTFGAGAGAAVGGAGAGAGADDAETTERRRRIVMGCPASGCGGFVDTLWKCGMCDTKICKECHIVKTDTHTCNPDDMATATALAAETKPCPKCAAAISKVSGCDQMWCTQCHTTFSWNTGRVETSIVHNPHYFQWMAANGHAIPRADLPGAVCDIDELTFRAIWRHNSEINTIADPLERSQRRRDLDLITERRRQRLDMEAIQLRRVRDRVRDHMAGGWRRELCVKRLSGDITEAEWQISLQRAEKAHHKERAWLQLMEMYAVTSRDILGRIATEAAPNFTEIVMEHERLHQFTYEQNLAISKAYQCIVLKLTPDMKEPEKKTREKKAVKPAAAVGGAGGAGAAAVDDDAEDADE